MEEDEGVGAEENFRLGPPGSKAEKENRNNNFRACLFRCKTSQVVSRKMRMEKVNCRIENILCFTVFD